MQCTADKVCSGSSEEKRTFIKAGVPNHGGSRYGYCQADLCCHGRRTPTKQPSQASSAKAALFTNTHHYMESCKDMDRAVDETSALKYV